MTNPHPTAEVLAAFAAGRLSGPPADAVEEHVAECPVCVAALAELPADPLLALARACAPAFPAGAQPDDTP